VYWTANYVERDTRALTRILRVCALEKVAGDALG
jgi:hypothetical protein